MDRHTGEGRYPALWNASHRPLDSGLRRNDVANKCAFVLAARVMLVMQLLQPFAGDMGVHLRRRDVGVAEQQLHHAQVGAVVQEVRGESVAQHVR